MKASDLFPPEGPAVLSRIFHRLGGVRSPLRARLACCLLATLLGCLAAQAYPPSPYHLVYGLVRDEFGTPISNPQVQILMVSTNGTQNSTTIQPDLAVDVNYQLAVPLDTLVRPDLYRSNALAVGTGFRMYVVVGNTTNVPMVSIGTSTILGQPTKMTRIDLTLGVDTNGDGIPDAWEMAFLGAIGSDLTLAQINANSVLTPDGHTLLQEYLQGPFFDTGNPFTARIVSYNGGAAILEFPTANGQSYTVLGSTNLQQWALLPFLLPSEGPGALHRTNYTASVVQTLQVQVIQSGPAPKAEFFRIQQH